MAVRREALFHRVTAVAAVGAHKQFLFLCVCSRSRKALHLSLFTCDVSIVAIAVVFSDARDTGNRRILWVVEEAVRA
jgi:hypothetical protein